jgi:hypothetical protein
MQLLDSNIQDVALRPGAGSYVQFNEREGGIGMAATANSLSITATDGQTTHSARPFNNLIHLVYSGGTSASAAVDPATGYTNLRGDPDSVYVTSTQNIGSLMLAQDNGAKIKLDYDRVRIVSAGLVDSAGTNLIQVTFIHLVKGEITADAGAVNVMVQQVDSNPLTWTFAGTEVGISVSQNGEPQIWTASPPQGAQRTVVVFSEVVIEVSIK